MFVFWVWGVATQNGCDVLGRGLKSLLYFFSFGKPIPPLCFRWWLYMT